MSDDEIVEALESARIPKMYRAPNMSLGKYGPAAEELKRWVDSKEAAQSIRSGRGRMVAGATPEAMDVFFLFGRALVLRGVGVRVYSIVRMMDELHAADSREFRQDLDDVDALLIVGFFDGHFKRAFDDSQRIRMEWFLTERLQRLQSICLHAAIAVATPEHAMLGCTWWSEPFLKRIAKLTETTLV